MVNRKLPWSGERNHGVKSRRQGNGEARSERLSRVQSADGRRVSPDRHEESQLSLGAGMHESHRVTVFK